MWELLSRRVSLDAASSERHLSLAMRGRVETWAIQVGWCLKRARSRTAFKRGQKRTLSPGRRRGQWPQVLLGKVLYAYRLCCERGSQGSKTDGRRRGFDSLFASFLDKTTNWPNASDGSLPWTETLSHSRSPKRNTKGGPPRLASALCSLDGIDRDAPPDD